MIGLKDAIEDLDNNIIFEGARMLTEGECILLLRELQRYIDIGMKPDEIVELKEVFNDLGDSLSPPYKRRDLIFELKNLRAELAGVKAEREAAIKDIPRSCYLCKGCEHKDEIQNIHGGCSALWQWRGRHDTKEN